MLVVLRCSTSSTGSTVKMRSVVVLLMFHVGCASVHHLVVLRCITSSTDSTVKIRSVVVLLMVHVGCASVHPFQYRFNWVEIQGSYNFGHRSHEQLLHVFF